MDRIASVVMSNSIKGFDKEYHYLVPNAFLEKAKVGMRVIVPFGKSNRNKEGYILRFVDNSEISGLKEIKKVIDDKPLLNEKMINLANWMRYRYSCTYGDALKCMIPPGIGVKSVRTVKLTGNPDGLGKNQKKIVDILRENGNECGYEDLKELSGLKSFSSCIKALERLNVIEISEKYSSNVRDKKVRVAYLAVSADEIASEIESNKIRMIQHIRVLEMLMDNEYLSVSDIMRFAGVSRGVLDTLGKRGYISFKDIEVTREPGIMNRPMERTAPLKPTLEQEAALAEVKKQLDKGAFGEMLLHGVTGSGKTEIYLQLISYVAERGKQAIVLVPEISLTPQMVERFRGRFGDEVAVLHSRLSLGERYDQWKLIKEGKIKIVVGARSAVFAPVDKLGIIIIDEEHETSYKSEVKPKYNASEIARKRCQDENAVLLYGSATPSLETYFRASTGDIGLVELTSRVNNMVMPDVRLVDMRRELEEGNRSIFSRLLAEEIEKNILSGQQTMLFLNRRGHSTFVLCRNCGYVVKCANCSISMIYHSHEERLICHYCGYTLPVPKTCPACGSRYIRHFGTGTQKVEEEVKRLFPGCSVIRMDMDTTTGKNSHEEILTRFKEENINVMVGTQMIAKGHDFPNVTLVGVIAADSLLNVGDYRASERTFQLLTQVAGRAGRGELPGRVIIQAYNTEDFSISTACKHDYASFYNQEIKLREKLNYPPFSNIAVVILHGHSDRLTFKKAKSVKEFIDTRLSAYEAEVLGPARSSVYKIKNRYRWRIIIKCKPLDILIDVLRQVDDEYGRAVAKDQVELGMDINPFNML